MCPLDCGCVDKVSLPMSQERLDSITKLAGDSVSRAAEELVRNHLRNRRQVAHAGHTCIAGVQNAPGQSVPDVSSPGIGAQVGMHTPARATPDRLVEGTACPATVRKHAPSPAQSEWVSLNVLRSVEAALERESAKCQEAEAAASKASAEADALVAELDRVNARLVAAEASVHRASAAQLKTAAVGSKLRLLSELLSPMASLSPATEMCSDIGSLTSTDLATAEDAGDGQVDAAAPVQSKDASPRRTRRNARMDGAAPKPGIQNDLQRTMRTRSGLRA